uniref:Uncharacterized protein n=1 Tax=Manihot esculenta TaxID=3983 RepID=A0A2C9UFH2_MANES
MQGRKSQYRFRKKTTGNFRREEKKMEIWCQKKEALTL